MRAVKAIPAVLREKRENVRARHETRTREMAQEKRRKWEEKAKASEEAPPAAAGEAPAAAE